LQVLLNVSLQDHGSGVCSRDTCIAATWNVGVECVGVFARE
jgi:hypothetical protein